LTLKLKEDGSRRRLSAELTARSNTSAHNRSRREISDVLARGVPQRDIMKGERRLQKKNNVWRENEDGVSIDIDQDCDIEGGSG